MTDLDSGTGASPSPSPSPSHLPTTLPADYRRIPRALSRVYYHPLTSSTTREITKLFAALTADPADPPIRTRTLTTWGRTLRVPESTRRVARFEFRDLCGGGGGNAWGAADYLEITRTFGTVFLLGVPKMGLGEKDLARRFITFIDACYESKVLLCVCVWAAPGLTPMFANSTDEAVCHLRSADLPGVLGRPRGRGRGWAEGDIGPYAERHG